MPDPTQPLSEMEKRVFGARARRHAITGFVLEDGIGALPIKQQARQHLQIIASTQGKAAATIMRYKLDEYEQTNGY